MSDCKQTTHRDWTLGELGYSQPLSDRELLQIKKEWQESAQYRKAELQRHREQFPEKYDAQGLRILEW